jgi:hypothetical protein
MAGRLEGAVSVEENRRSHEAGKLQHSIDVGGGYRR